MTLSEPTSTRVESAQQVRYGGFWLRAAAFLIDWVIVALGLGLLAVGTSGPGLILGWAIPWIYEALLLSSEHQATLGKKAVGLIVTDSEGARLNFPRATGRHFAKYLSCLFLGIGFVLAAFTARKQALHDFIAGTLVIVVNRK